MLNKQAGLLLKNFKSFEKRKKLCSTEWRVNFTSNFHLDYPKKLYFWVEYTSFMMSVEDGLLLGLFDQGLWMII